MKLYWLPAEHRYVHRLSDIPKGADSETQEIGTDLASLMATLNELHGEIVSQRNAFQSTITSINVDGPDTHVLDEADRVRIDEAFQRGVNSVKCPEFTLADGEPGIMFAPLPEATMPSELRVSKPMDATAVLSRMDNPKVDVEAVVEAIGKSKPYALKRYAGAVAVRFQELGKVL